jgi:hypothetical protein
MKETDQIGQVVAQPSQTRSKIKDLFSELEGQQKMLNGA